MNIVVLAGGISTERQVSLSSGSMVVKALKKLGHQAILLDSFLGRQSVPQPIEEIFSSEEKIAQAVVEETEPDLEKIKASRTGDVFGSLGPHVLEICRAAHIVYMGLHGENGENGRLQALFDVLEIKYTGSGYLGSALAMNKWITKQILLQAGILTPKGKAYRKGQDTSDGAQFGFPCIVKPCSGGSSIGVSIVHNQVELENALEQAFTYEQEVLIEEYIPGREFSVGILGDQPLPAIEIIPKSGFYDYSHKYQKGWTQEICPAQVDSRIAAFMQQAALQVFDALHLEVYGRIDFMLDAQGNAYCLEANTLPGMTPTSLLPQEAQAAGISYEQLCQQIIQLSLQRF